MVWNASKFRGDLGMESFRPCMALAHHSPRSPKRTAMAGLSDKRCEAVSSKENW